MAVREKTLTRTVCSVKHLPTGSTHPVIAHKKFWSAAVLLPLLRSQPIRKFTQPSKTARRAFRAPEVRHKLNRSQGRQRLSRQNHPTSPFSPPSNTSHTTPKSDSTDPPNASPPEIHPAPADKPPTPSPLHTASTPDKAPDSAPADQPYPHPPAAPRSASSLSSNARRANYSEIPPAAPTAPHKTI